LTQLDSINPFIIQLNCVGLHEYAVSCGYGTDNAVVSTGKTYLKFIHVLPYSWSVPSGDNTCAEQTEHFEIQLVVIVVAVRESFKCGR